MKLFDGLGSESEERWSAYKDGKHFHICRDGSRAYAENYLSASYFRNGFAVVAQNNEDLGGWERFHIRPDGSRPYRQSYDQAGDFDKLGYARVVRHDGTLCFVDDTGNEITFEEYRKKL